MSDYITIAGIVQFDPRTRTAGDKQVRDVVIRAIGNNKNYSVTIWPEKANIPINKGDVLFVDGKLSQSVGQNKAGEQVTYNNLSATAIVRIACDTSSSPTTTDDTVSVSTGDEFPF